MEAAKKPVAEIQGDPAARGGVWGAGGSGGARSGYHTESTEELPAQRRVNALAVPPAWRSNRLQLPRARHLNSSHCGRVGVRGERLLFASDSSSRPPWDLMCTDGSQTSRHRGQPVQSQHPEQVLKALERCFKEQGWWLHKKGLGHPPRGTCSSSASPHAPVGAGSRLQHQTKR